MTTDAPYAVGPSWASDVADDINAARQSVSLTALSVLPSSRSHFSAWGALWGALIAAPRRGCYVRVIVPMPSPAHPATARNAAAGIIMTRAGITVHLVHGPDLLHAKTILIDDRIAWVGSGNLTNAAATRNHEFWLRAVAGQPAAALRAFHEGLVQVAAVSP